MVSSFICMGGEERRREERREGRREERREERREGGEGRRGGEGHPRGEGIKVIHTLRKFSHTLTQVSHLPWI